MAKRSRDLIKQSQATRQSTQTVLQNTAPKATLGGIKQAAAKKFGQRKPTKKQQQPKKQQPKKTQPKKPKAVSSDRLDQWQKAMEKANIPRHRWRKLEDKISRLSGTQRQEIEEELFEHDMFKDVYEAGEDDPSIVDDYLSDLEDKLDDVTSDAINVIDMVDNVNEFMQKNPTLGVVAVKYVVGGNTMEFKAHETDNGVVFEDENGGLIAGFDSTELDSIEMSLLEDIYTVVQDESNWTDIEPLSPEEFKQLLEETKRNRLD